MRHGKYGSHFAVPKVLESERSLIYLHNWSSGLLNSFSEPVTLAETGLYVSSYAD
jgi:hypothetical protein